MGTYDTRGGSPISPNVEEGYCAICQASCDGCNCPECEVCGVAGDPACINVHMPWSKWPTLCGLTPRAADERKQSDLALEAEIKFERETQELLKRSPLT